MEFFMFYFSILHFICHHTVLFQCFWIRIIAHFRQQKDTRQCHNDFLAGTLIIFYSLEFLQWDQNSLGVLRTSSDAGHIRQKSNPT